MDNEAFDRSESVSAGIPSDSRNISLVSFAAGEATNVPRKNTKRFLFCFPKVRKMYLAAFTALLWAVAMGLMTGYSSPATYDMKNDPQSSVKPTEDEVTWIGSVLALGAMLGSLVAGPLADKLGRKDALICNIVPVFLGWTIISCFGNVFLIMIGRFFCGISCGIISVVVPMYCVEISTPEVRGLLGSLFQGFLVMGNLMSVVVGSVVSWVNLAVIGEVFSALAFLSFIPMSKSPRWLLAQAKGEAAVKVMENLHGDFVDAKAECDEISKSLQSAPKGRISFKELKQPVVYKPMLISVALMVFQQASGANAILFYSSNIFKAAKNFMDPKNSTIVLGAVQVIATLLSNFTVDKAGRKALLLLSGAFMCLTLVGLGTYYHILKTNSGLQEYSWITLVCLNLFVVAFSIGYGSIPWLLVAEMVPIRARSLASGLASFTNGLFAFIITKSFSASEVLIGEDGTYWLYSAVSLLGTIFVALVLPETKGKKLEEIEKIFESQNASEKA